MKVKNLLKKVGSVITTAALLATLGTTAFAEKYSDSVSTDNSITITDVNTVQHKVNNVPVEGVYDVTVSYETTVKNVTGMTLLAYRSTGSDGKPAANELDTTKADNNKYTDAMQIVGIEQNAAVDGTSDNKTGSFTFTVTTNSTSNGAYYIEKGKKALVAVSGDQCNPAYALFGVNATATSAKCTLGSETEPVSIEASKNLNQELNTMVIADKIAFYDENNNAITATADLSGVDFSSVTWTKDSSGVYKATVTLPKANISGVDIKGESINVELTAYVKIQAVPGTVTKLGSATVENDAATISVNNSVLKDATDLSKLTTYLTNNYKSVQLTADKLTDTIENGASFVALDNYGADTTSYTYTATVNAGTGKDGKVKLEATKSITVTVNITSDSITDVKLMKDNAEVIGGLDSVQVPSDTTEDKVPNAVKGKLSGYSLSYTENKDGSTEQKTIALTDNKVGYTNKVESDKVTFTIATIDGIALVSPFSVVVPYTIAPAVKYGDITGAKDSEGNVIGNGKVEMDDVNLAFQAAVKNKTLEPWQIEAADVATPEPNGKIEMDDVNKIFQYAVKNITKFPVEK